MMRAKNAAPRVLSPTLRRAIGPEFPAPNAPAASFRAQLFQARRATVLLDQGAAAPGALALRRAVRDEFQALSPSAQRAAMKLVTEGGHQRLKSILDATPLQFARSQVGNAVEGAVVTVLDRLFGRFLPNLDIPS